MFRVPHFFFFLGKRFHEFGHDLVFAYELGFELLDFLVLAILAGLVFTAIGKGEVPILKEFFEPVVELVGVDVEFIAQVRNGNLVDEVPFENGDLVGIGKMTTRLVHDETSVQVILTRTKRFSRFD